MNFKTSTSFAFTQAANSFRYNFDLKMNEINLHAGQVFILVSLWKIDRQSQIDLAIDLKLSAPTINKMVKSLIESGFVECNKCGSDGRKMRVHLTQKGVEHKELVEEKFLEFETEFFSKLTETENLILVQIFEKINGSFLEKKSLNKTV